MKELIGITLSKATNTALFLKAAKTVCPPSMTIVFVGWLWHPSHCRDTSTQVGSTASRTLCVPRNVEKIPIYPVDPMAFARRGRMS